MKRIRFKIALIVVLIFSSEYARTAGRTIEINPGTNVFSAAAQSLIPGDTLIVHQGTYNETVRMSIQVLGAVSSPILIMGAPGESRPLITRSASASIQNTINIEGTAAYLTIRGLEVTGNGGDGVNMSGTLSHVTLRSEEHTSELQSLRHLVCRLLL